jgi:hypothetical protein
MGYDVQTEQELKHVGKEKPGVKVGTILVD